MPEPKNAPTEIDGAKDEWENGNIFYALVKSLREKLLTPQDAEFMHRAIAQKTIGGKFAPLTEDEKIRHNLVFYAGWRCAACDNSPYDCVCRLEEGETHPGEIIYSDAEVIYKSRWVIYGADALKPSSGGCTSCGNSEDDCADVCGEPDGGYPNNLPAAALAELSETCAACLNCDCEGGSCHMACICTKGVEYQPQCRCVAEPDGGTICRVFDLREDFAINAARRIYLTDYYADAGKVAPPAVQNALTWMRQCPCAKCGRGYAGGD